MTASVSFGQEYREIDRLLEARASTYPVRTEPVWSDLNASLTSLAAGLRESVCRPPRSVPSDRAVAAATAALDSPIFVVGYYKSGTTLLAALLDDHRELSVFPSEARYFNSFLPSYGALAREQQLDQLHSIWINRLINPTGQPPFWTLGHPASEGLDPYERFSSYLYWFAGRAPDVDLLAVVATTLIAVRLDLDSSAPAPHSWVTKTPTNEFRVDSIVRVFPNARFVHIVRDPRDAIAAISRLPSWPFDACSESVNLARSLTAARENADRLGADRYHVVRYEDVVADPETSMQKAAAALGIDFTDSLLVPTTAGRPMRANSSWAERRVTGSIHRLSLGRGAEALDRRTLRVVSTITGSAARALGYEIPVVSRPRMAAIAGSEVARRPTRLRRLLSPLVH